MTIGIPGFFRALAPSSGPFRSERLLRAVARFAVPAGAAAGLGVLAAYLFALNIANLPLVESRTVAATALVGLHLIVALEVAAGRVSRGGLDDVGLIREVGSSSSIRSRHCERVPLPASK